MLRKELGPSLGLLEESKLGVFEGLVLGTELWVELGLPEDSPLG